MNIIGDRALVANLQRIAANAPKVVSRTLTNLAFEIAAETKKELPRWLKITRPFLAQSVVYEGATPAKLVARVGFLQRADFANLLEKGGTRKPNNKAIAVPTGDLKRNAKGGITTANRPRTILTKANVFSGDPAGKAPAGIWQRIKRGKKTTLKMLYVYKSQTSYDANQINFVETAQKVGNRKGAALLQKNLDRLFTSNSPTP